MAYNPLLNPHPVSGPLTDVQLRASGVAVTFGALPAGTNNIGDVDVLTLPPLVAGTAAIGTVGVTALPALVAGTAAIGTVAINAALPAGTNTIGAVFTPKIATATTPVQTAVGTASVAALAALATRKRLMIVNTGTTVIKLALGGAPTQTAYHIALGAASAADNGTGGVYTDDDWTGAVNAISSAAGGTIVITELT